MGEVGLLDRVGVATPCGASWEGMKGDDRVRFCGLCKLNVYNLSGMSRADAEELVAKAEGRTCIRFFRRDDGTVLTQDCPVGFPALARRKLAVGIAAVSAAMATATFGAFGFLYAKNAQSAQLPPPPPPRHTMGEVTMGKVAVRPRPAPPKTPGTRTTPGTPPAPATPDSPDEGD